MKYEPDKRWKHWRSAVGRDVDSLEASLQALADLDAEAMDGVWSEYVAHAVGCLEGIKQLLQIADKARAKHITGTWPEDVVTNNTKTGE